MRSLHEVHTSPYRIHTGPRARKAACAWHAVCVRAQNSVSVLEETHESRFIASKAAAASSTVTTTGSAKKGTSLLQKQADLEETNARISEMRSALDEAEARSRALEQRAASLPQLCDSLLRVQEKLAKTGRRLPALPAQVVERCSSADASQEADDDELEEPTEEADTKSAECADSSESAAKLSLDKRFHRMSREAPAAAARPLSIEDRLRRRATPPIAPRPAAAPLDHFDVKANPFAV